jgi:putative DNA primase/helicase
LGKKLGIYANGETLPVKPADIWQSCDPPPGTLGPDLGGFDTVHVYRNATGEPVRYIGRKEAKGDKRKIFVPITYGNLNGVVGWHKKQASKPRCLYGLDRISATPDAVVIVVEGEKAADAASAMFPQNPCITWSGGAESVTSNDWSPLAGRRIIVWPDNDGPGHKAAAALRTIYRKVRTLRTSPPNTLWHGSATD